MRLAVETADGRSGHRSTAYPLPPGVPGGLSVCGIGFLIEINRLVIARPPKNDNDYVGIFQACALLPG